MRAYEFRKAGKPGVLKMKEFPEPIPEENEVKVKIECIGINYAEILSRKGQYRWRPKAPYIPGMEAYGEIVEVGKKVSDRKVGEKVIVGQQYGCYAEYTCVTQHLCFPAISDFTPEENAAFLVNFMTAWIALKKMCRVEAGERVLIHAAAGGVGTAAVQIAKVLGCFVYGTASKQEKLELIEKLGADKAINYRTEDFYEVVIEHVGKVDCVLEVVGGEVFKKSMELLHPFGRIAVIGFASINFKIWNPITWYRTWKDAPKANVMSMLKKSQGVFASHIGYLIDYSEVTSTLSQELKSFVVQNKIKPIVGKVYEFDQIAEAHQFMEMRDSVGKIIVRV
jgi:NADPH2:quinone reductase